MISMRPLFLVLMVGAVLAAGCGTKQPATVTSPNGIGPFRGLRATPRQLAFTCVTPLCDTTLVVKVQSTVNRRVAIKQVVMSKMTDEYRVTPSVATPFILGASSDFSIDVKYAPLSAPGAEDLKVIVTYTDASPNADDPDRIEPRNLEIPLVRRLVGEPVLDAQPRTLSFGLVRQGESKELPVLVRNVGFGNIALEVDSFDAGHPWISMTLPQGAALVPDSGVSIPVTFSPKTLGYYRGDVIIGSSTPGVGEIDFEVEGTSFTEGVIAVEPEERAIDFGDVPRRQRRTITVQAANVGGSQLVISSVTVRDVTNNVRVSLPNAMTRATLAPLERIALTVELTAAAAGPVDATLAIASTDSSRPSLEIPVRGTVAEPRIEVTPSTLVWGPTPLGWQVSKPLQLRNAGFGPLSIRRITFVGGSSNLFSLKDLPALPLTLPTGGRTSLEVEFRADTMASFTGSLSIESDDPTTQLVEVPLSANVVNCSSGCAVANATPSCMNGQCRIASCNSGYYNTDGMASNGCECRETGSDVSEFCSMGVYKGVLKDTSGGTAQHQGVIPTAGDVDWIRFHAEDATTVFSEDFNVRITLSSNDPTIEMCVYRKGGSSHDTTCYNQGESCGSRSYRRSGSFGTDDAADFDIKVYRRANAAPTCATYTVSMSNG
jgi:hypothetical protein